MAVIKDLMGLAYAQSVNIKGVEEKRVDLVLSPISIPKVGEVTGVIKDDKGQPIKNAYVKVFDTEFNPINHTKTNNLGEYAIYDIKHGTYVVGVDAEGFKLAVKPTCVVAEGSNPVINIALEADEESVKGYIQGRVRVAGTKEYLKGVVVNVTKSNLLVQETMTAIDGEYAVTKLEDGDYYIKPSKNGYKATSDNGVKVTILNGNLVDLDLEMTAIFVTSINGTLNGCIKGIDGKPIKRATVLVLKFDSETGTEKWARRPVITDEAGQYFCSVPEDGDFITKAIHDALVSE